MNLKCLKSYQVSSPTTMYEASAWDSKTIMVQYLPSIIYNLESERDK